MAVFCVLLSSSRFQQITKWRSLFCVKFIFVLIYSTFLRELTYVPRGLVVSRAGGIASWNARVNLYRICYRRQRKIWFALCIYLIRVLNNNTDHYLAQYHYMQQAETSVSLFEKNARWFLRITLYEYIGWDFHRTSRVPSHRTGTISLKGKPFTHE